MRPSSTTSTLFAAARCVVQSFTTCVIYAVRRPVSRNATHAPRARKQQSKPARKRFVKNAERLDPLETEGSAACDFLFSELQILCIGLDFEKQAHSEGYKFVAGVDEVGRG